MGVGQLGLKNQLWLRSGWHHWGEISLSWHTEAGIRKCPSLCCLVIAAEFGLSHPGGPGFEGRKGHGERLRFACGRGHKGRHFFPEKQEKPQDPGGYREVEAWCCEAIGDSAAEDSSILEIPAPCMG